MIREYGWIIKTIINKHLFYLEEYKEECFNDILLAVWNNIEYYNSEKSSFKNWLGVISRHKSIDYIRMYLKYNMEENIENKKIVVEENSLKNLLLKERNNEIKKILSYLNEEDRMIFERYYLDGENIKDISEDIDIKESSIYSRLSRGRKKIRNSVKGGRDNER